MGTMSIEKNKRVRSARKAANARWSVISPEERSKIMSKISSKGGKARWKNKLSTDGK